MFAIRIQPVTKNVWKKVVLYLNRVGKTMHVFHVLYCFIMAICMFKTFNKSQFCQCFYVRIRGGGKPNPNIVRIVMHIGILAWPLRDHLKIKLKPKKRNFFVWGRGFSFPFPKFRFLGWQEAELQRLQDQLFT
jgi:hypothetical protein